MDVIAISPEFLVVCNNHFEVKVAIRAAIISPAAFSSDADLLSGVDAGGDIDGQIALDALISATAASMAFVADDLARSATTRAGRLSLRDAEYGPLLLDDDA